MFTMLGLVIFDMYCLSVITDLFAHNTENDIVLYQIINSYNLLIFKVTVKVTFCNVITLVCSNRQYMSNITSPNIVNIKTSKNRTG
jgi:hypothetical protein